MTLREITYLHDASDARETRTDYYTARIVSMIAAVNSKHGRYDPAKYMLNGREIKAQRGRRAAKTEGMTGEAIVSRLKYLGVPVVDLRGKQ